MIPPDLTPVPTEPESSIQEEVLRARLGNRDAFERLVLAHHPRLRAWVARHLDREDDVSEVVQETFLGALRSLHQVDPTRPFGAWLHGICRNHLYRFLQRRMKGRSRQQALVDQAMAESLAETDDEDSARRMLALRHCLEGMEAGQRELLDQRYRDQIPVQDLASQLNTTPGSISMRLLRLKAALARCIRSRLESNR